MVDSVLVSLREMKKEYQTKGKEAFSTLFSEIFAKYPFLEGAQWKQYTPYFCDGDPCYFSISVWGDEGEGVTLLVKNQGVNEYINYDDTHEYERREETDEDGQIRVHYDRIDNPAYQEMVPVFAEVSNLVRSFDTDLLEEIFEDEGTITVYRSGEITIEECHHD